MRRRGFTLIEVLLAMAIFAIILALAGTVVVESLKTAEYLEIRGADQRLATALLSRIRADVQDAIVTGNDDPPHFLASTAEGKARLDLVTLADAQPDDQGREADLCEAGYLFTLAGGSRWNLYRREQRLVDAQPTQGGELLLLTDRLGSFSLQYSDDGAAWVDAYNSKERGRLPWAVKVSFTILPEELPEGEATGVEPPPPSHHEEIFFLNRYGLLPNGD